MLGWVYLIASVVMFVLGVMAFPRINSDFSSVIYFAAAFFLSLLAMAGFWMSCCLHDYDDGVSEQPTSRRRRASRYGLHYEVAGARRRRQRRSGR